MDVFRREDLRQLIQCKTAPCVSIFMPTVRSGHERQQNPVRLRNLLKQAEDSLRAKGVPGATVQKVLAPARELNEASDLWNAPSDGLALFLAPDFLSRWRVPLKLKEELFVDDHFHVAPLLPLLQCSGRYYLLALSQNHVALFEGTEHSLRRLEWTDLPKSLQDALQIDEYVDAIQFHTSGQQQAGGTEPVGRKATVFHGHGAGNLEERKRADLLEYFRRVDDALQEHLGGEHAPLVFAGVEYLFPLFRQACHYRYLVPEEVKGNPDHLSEAELHERSWQVVEPYLRDEERKLLKRYEDAAGSDHVADRVELVVPAAQQGAVDVLLARQGAEVFGRVDPQKGTVKDLTSERPRADSANGWRELVDYATVQTLLHGGRVLVLEPERMPVDSPVAALLRYPLPSVNGSTR